MGALVDGTKATSERNCFTIIDWSCQYWSHDHSVCFLHDSKQFGDILNALSAILCLIAVLCEILIYFSVNELELYDGETNTNPFAVYRATQLRNLQDDRNEVDGDGKHFIRFHNSEQKLKTKIFKKSIRKFQLGKLKLNSHCWGIPTQHPKLNMLKHHGTHPPTRHLHQEVVPLR